MPPHRIAFERFWEKVVVGPVPDYAPHLGHCWLWTGAKTYGYGIFNAGNNHTGNAHIWAYGPVPDGLELDHLCRAPACVRPTHLEAVTHAENVRRGRGGNLHIQKTHCPLGHIYETRISGRRFCRVCHHISATRYARANKDIVNAARREARALRRLAR